MNKNYSFAFPRRQLQLHAMLISCGRQDAVSTAYNWNGLKRGSAKFVLWQYTIGGEGELIYEGKSHRLRNGDSMLLNIPHDHCYRLPADSRHWQFIYACLNGKEIIRICMELVRRRGPIIKLEPESTAPATLNRTILAASKGLIDNQYKASHTAYRLIMDLSEAYGLNDYEDFPLPIQKAIDYCLRNPSTGHDVAAMAKEANCSRWHFSRLFKQATGMTPAAFVRDQQMHRASALLETGTLSVKEVAEQCGFNSAVSFCRAYKREFGLTPGQKQK